MNLTLAPIGSKLFILYITVQCIILLKVGTTQRSKNFWRVRVTTVFIAIQKSFIICISELHVDDRTVKLTVFMYRVRCFCSSTKKISGTSGHIFIIIFKF